MEGMIIPDYIGDLEEIKSENINIFFDYYGIKSSNIYNRTISIEYLENYKNKESYNPLIKELSFRGFVINSEKENDILPKLPEIKYENIITVEANERVEEYKKIPFDILGVWDTLSQFSIQKDSFFDGIPLENFLYINKNIDVNLLRTFFQNNGFIIKQHKEASINHIKKEAMSIGLEKDTSLIEKHRINNGISDEREDELQVKVRTAILPNKDNTIDSELLEDIRLYLIAYFKSESMRSDINIRKIYMYFFKQMMINNTTEHQLYEYLKHEMSNFFNFGKGNTMTIELVNSKRKSAEEILAGLVEGKGGMIDKEYVSKKLGWSWYIIDRTVSQSDKLKITGGIISKVNYKSKKSPFNDYLQKIIREELNNSGYILIAPLFTRLQFDENHNTELKRLNIIKGSDLAKYLKILFASLEGNSKFLYEFGNEWSLTQIIMDNLNEEFSRNVFLEMMRSYGYSEKYSYSFLADRLHNNEFVEIDYDLLILSSKLHIDPVIEYDVLEYLKHEVFASQNHFAFVDLKGYKYRFPEIEFEWTPYLVKYIAKKNGYKEINRKRKTMDYRSDRLIMVTRESKISSFGELIRQLLKNYTGNKHQTSVHEYLQSKGILNEKEYIMNKKLLSELVEENIIAIDALGYVSLND